MATREQFDEAVEALFRTGQPIRLPSLEMLAAWDPTSRTRPARSRGCDGASCKSKAAECYEQFPARIIEALKTGNPSQSPGVRPPAAR